jgi:hypothetical protein
MTGNRQYWDFNIVVEADAHIAGIPRRAGLKKDCWI